MDRDPALSTKHAYDFPEVGVRNMYMMYHEELESLVTHFPEIKKARFWMTFGDAYLTHLEVLQNVGMTSIEPVSYEGQQIIPLQFLKAVLPNPGDLGKPPLAKPVLARLFPAPIRARKRPPMFIIFVTMKPVMPRLDRKRSAIQRACLQ